MDRQTLINLSFVNGGEYYKIMNAIKNHQLDVPKAPVDNCITILDSDYPKELTELKEPPLVLWYKGNLDLLKKDKVGVVGTRNPSEYSINATTELCKKINKKVIVSGLAKGIDAIAHANSKETIAVLGCGIDYIYPFENKDIYKDIANNGLILSEYPLSTPPLAHHFPYRNRIVSALSKNLYVMETNNKSGTMNTLYNSLELGRNVYVLPMPYYSTAHNNKLINEGANAIIFDELEE